MATTQEQLRGPEAGAEDPTVWYIKIDYVYPHDAAVGVRGRTAGGVSEIWDIDTSDLPAEMRESFVAGETLLKVSERGGVITDIEPSDIDPDDAFALANS